jgi:hypothetical protein
MISWGGKTCAKQAIAFWDRLGRRLRIPGQPRVLFLCPTWSAGMASQPETGFSPKRRPCHQGSN